jgi:hypothetical protein
VSWHNACLDVCVVHTYQHVILFGWHSRLLWLYPTVCTHPPLSYIPCPTGASCCVLTHPFPTSLPICTCTCYKYFLYIFFIHKDWNISSSWSSLF